jgi:hypothetical protein
VSGPEVSVSVPLGGVDAKLKSPSRRPTEQRARAAPARRLKKPEYETQFLFMMMMMIFGIHSELIPARTPLWTKNELQKNAGGT